MKTAVNAVQQGFKKKLNLIPCLKKILLLCILTGHQSCTISYTKSVKLKIQTHHSTTQIMPDLQAPNPITPAVISAGSGLLGSIVGGISSGIQNKKNRKWSEQMYQRQRADALSFWNMQNEYNSPAAQMARFQAAGLNPNRIYGAGSPGNAESIPVQEAPTPRTETPDWGGGLQAAANGGIAAYMDATTRRLQNDNLAVQNTNLQKEGLLIEAQINKLGIETARGKYDLDFETRMQDISADARRLSNRKLELDIDLSQRRDWRETVQMSSNLREASERIATMESQRANNEAQRRQIMQNIELMKKDGVLKDWEISLSRQNITKNDPYYFRLTERALAPFLTGEKSYLEQGAEWMREQWRNLQNLWNDTPQSTSPGGSEFNINHPNKK